MNSVNRTYEMIMVEGGSCCSSYRNVRANVGSFYIGSKLVTWELWEAVAGSPVNKPDYIHISENNKSTLPVTYISWYDANEFIAKLNERYNANYRLPSAIEWEYAAKGGCHYDNYKYSGSNNFTEVAQSGRDSSGHPRLYPVGTLKPNSLGLYDMSGLLHEWSSDDDILVTKKLFWTKRENCKVVLGGSIADDGPSVLRNCRRLKKPEDFLGYFGLRLAHDIDSYKPITF